jgi:DNA polymerase elongation subunit (family B)
MDDRELTEAEYQLIKSRYNELADRQLHCDEVREWIFVYKGNIITPPERCIDIFSVTSKTVPTWQSKVTLEPYENLTKVYLDIETTKILTDDPELRAKSSQLKAIGIMNEKGQKVFIREESELQMLEILFRFLNKKQPDILFTFNGTNFDLSYLFHKSQQLGIRSPFFISYDYQYRFAAAELAGRYQDIGFYPVYCKFNGKRCDHVDIYQLAIAYDSVLRKFTKYSLKELPIQLGLRDTPRLDLGLEGLEEAYRTGNWESVKEYLFYDLEDTQLLADFLMPSLYYQLVYFPKYNLQKLATSGNASKWNSNLDDYYGEANTKSLPPNVPYGIQGAITHTVSGIHTDVAGCDFSGQYPSCMMQYGIHSQHDPDMLMLAIMQQGVEYRMAIKYKENITQAEIDLTTAIKPVLNSAYGSLKAQIPYGDSFAAAMVTLFARARLKWAMGFVEAMGGQVVLTDTDSVYVKTDKTDIHKYYPISQETLKKLPPNPSDKLLSAVAIVEQIKENIPSGSKLDLEAVNKILFIPPEDVPRNFEKSYKFKTTNGKKFIEKSVSKDPKLYQWIVDNFGAEKVSYNRIMQACMKFGIDLDLGNIKKNYIKVEWNPKKQKFGLTAKGRYKKRDKLPLEKKFQVRFLELYAESPKSAIDYYQETLALLVSGEYPKDQLTVTRKIRVGEVKLINLGFGQERDTVSYYIGIDGQPTTTGDYDVTHYADILREMYEEMACFLDEFKPEPLKEEVEQLSLFV